MWTYALLALMLVFTREAGIWPDGGSSHRKRVFSPCFLVVCSLVAVFEIMALSYYYGLNG